jgi:hypothetical protein
MSFIYVLSVDVDGKLTFTLEKVERKFWAEKKINNLAISYVHI